VYALDAHLTRMGAVIGALRATGGTSRPAPATGGSRSPGRDAAQAATHEAVLALIEPDQDQLRLPAGTLAGAFLNLFFGRSRHPVPGDATVTVEQLVDLLLHGALASPTTVMSGTATGNRQHVRKRRRNRLAALTGAVTSPTIIWLTCVPVLGHPLRVTDDSGRLLKNWMAGAHMVQ
jgi:hypothetical protein